MIGVLKFYDPVKRYGFLIPEGGGEDVLLHMSEVGSVKRRLQPGIRFEYEPEQTEKGVRATKVRLLDEASAEDGGLIENG